MGAGFTAQAALLCFLSPASREPTAGLRDTTDERMPEIKADAREERLSGPQTVMHREREHVRKQMNAEALEKCHETRDAYVECAKGRTFSLPFVCRTVFKEFNACLSQYTTEEELDRRVALYQRPTQNYDPEAVLVRDGFKGDFFGTAKARGEQYRREAAEREAAERSAAH